GASGGIGRATPQAFGARGARVALLARGEVGLAGAVKDVESAAGQALAIPTDVADHHAVEAAAEQTENTLGPIDVWVNVGFASVVAPFTDIGPGGVPAGHRGQLPGVRVWHHERPQAHAPSQPRRLGGLGARLPRHTPPDRLLRGQARHPGLPRSVALR